ncbi:MAG TPA: hypothetical protein VFG69_21335 [Nannocystaceae bacterium]|nr:hypothetical protein [Nannocystaceae bacterium]
MHRLPLPLRLTLLAIVGATACTTGGRGDDDLASGTGSDSTIGDDGTVGTMGADDGIDETAGDGPDESGDGPADDSGGTEPGDAEPLVEALCAWDFACCDRGELDYRLGPFTADAADCSARFLEQLVSNDNTNESPRADLLYLLGFAVDLSRSAVDPAMVQACAEVVAARDCNAVVEPGACTAGSEDPCSLSALFVGLQDVGDPCNAGLAGFGFDIECAPGSTCEDVDGDWVCVDKGLVDEFCEGDDKCDEGLYCDLAVGRCALRSAEGESCAFEDDRAPDAGTETLPCLEHLTCDPRTETCVAFCSAGYDCADDSACPDGQSCVPFDIGDGVYTYCAPRGLDNGDRCDSHRDCADTLHCNGSACETDLAVDEVCAADDQCPSGSYCAGTCLIVENAGSLCATDSECNDDTTIGCITSADGTLCRTTRLANGEPCTPGQNAGGNWCTSGICEDLSDDAAANPRCQAGALSGAACDDDDATLGVPRCATTHYCDEGTCAPKSAAGGSCEDDGTTQCMNGVCTTIWADERCSDAPPLGSDTVTCDGA